jgi:hypothetical protein
MTRLETLVFFKRKYLGGLLDLLLPTRNYRESKKPQKAAKIPQHSTETLETLGSKTKTSSIFFFYLRVAGGALD